MMMLLRDASHHHHHHGVVTAWKDLYFPKGCGGPGPGTGAASGPGGVIGIHPGSPGSPGKQRILQTSQSSDILFAFKCLRAKLISLYVNLKAELGRGIWGTVVRRNTSPQHSGWKSTHSCSACLVCLLFSCFACSNLKMEALIFYKFRSFPQNYMALQPRVLYYSFFHRFFSRNKILFQLQSDY
jgi:hypothetical protein